MERPFADIRPLGPFAQRDSSVEGMGIAVELDPPTDYDTASEIDDRVNDWTKSVVGVPSSTIFDDEGVDALLSTDTVTDEDIEVLKGEVKNELRNQDGELDKILITIVNSDETFQL